MSTKSTFDKVITLGAFEHIGNLTKSFAKIAYFEAGQGNYLGNGQYLMVHS